MPLIISRFFLNVALLFRNIFNKNSKKKINFFHFRFELRLRFVPKDLQEMYQTQIDAFMFLHEQVLADYLAQVSASTI